MKAIWLPWLCLLTKSEKTLLNGLKVDECCEKTNLELRNFVGRLIQFIGRSMPFIGWFSVNALNFTRFFNSRLRRRKQLGKELLKPTHSPHLGVPRRPRGNHPPGFQFSKGRHCGVEHLLIVVQKPGFALGPKRRQRRASPQSF